MSVTPEAAARPPDFQELLSIIVPVYNEVRTVRAVLDRLIAIDLPLPREILVVDDGSTDGTGDLLTAAERDGLPVTVIRSERNGGKGNAMRKRLARARGTIVAIQDAGLELDPVQLGAQVQPIVSGATRVVYGSRFLDGGPRGRWRGVHRVTLPDARMGKGPTVELNLHVQPTFVPATTAGAGSQDARELGVRVFNVHVGVP